MRDEPQAAPGPAFSDYAARSRATRQRILGTAVDVLIEHGYSGASTLRIQQRAGVSRGRLLHQYPQRDALLVAAVQHIAEVRLEDSRGRSDWPLDPSARAKAAIDEMWTMYRRGHFWAATELWLAARNNAALAAALAPREQALGAAIRHAIDEMFGAQLNRHPHYPQLRDVLNTSMRGVALSDAFAARDPHTDPHVSSWKALALRELGMSD